MAHTTAEPYISHHDKAPSVGALWIMHLQSYEKKYIFASFFAENFHFVPFFTFIMHLPLANVRFRCPKHTQP